MAKTTTNINALRPIIVAAHNSGNHKAISKEMVQGANVDVEYFSAWVADVNALRETVKEYVLVKMAVRNAEDGNGFFRNKKVTSDDVFAARELIFPKWKEVLQVGEPKKNEKQLRVDEGDVEDLVKFAWDFMDSGKGTVKTIQSEQVFRKYVESMLGCIIAKNDVLDDDDRDALQSFRSAEKRVQKCIDEKSELNTQLKSFKLTRESLPKNGEEMYKKFLDNKITELEEALEKNEDKMETAKKDVAKYTKQARVILERINQAK